MKQDIDYQQLEQWILVYNSCENSKQKKQLLTLIVLACEPLVNKIARGLARRADDPIEDILQVANVGLMKGVKKYDISYKNLKIYLSYIIICEIKHYLRDKISSLKIPHDILELSYRINKLSADEIANAGEVYNKKQLADKLNVSENRIQEVYDVDRRHIISLDQIVFDEESNGKAYGENICDDKSELKDDDVEMKIFLNDSISQLPENYQKIIKSIYYDDISQTDLAKELNTSQSNISRMEKKSLQLLFDIITKDKKEI